MITRRSAGIPAIIVALISANPADNLFARALIDLQELSKAQPTYLDKYENVNLPQVHALNSLKAIFTTSKLSTRSEHHVVEVMRVAVQCLDSAT